MARIRQLPWDPVAFAEQNWLEHGWNAAAPGMAAVTSVLRAYRLYQARVDAVLKSLRLNSSRYEVLMLLFFSRRGSLPLGIISDRLQLNPGTITNTVDRLEVAGYVARQPNPLDGRGRLAVITKSGRTAAEQATAIVNAHVFEDVGLTKQEVRDLNHLLLKLRSHLG